MLPSVEQAFVGKDEKRFPLKTPASEAYYRSTKINKIWLSMHPGNFGFDKIIRPYVRPPFMLA